MYNLENFIKEQNITELTEKERKIQLIQSILKTQKELKQSHINFEYAEKELIDFYSYQIKANQSKLDYLINLAKTLNLEESYFITQL